MAKVLESYIFPKPCLGRPAAYKWDDWLDGQVWELKRPSDFRPQVPIFRSMVTTTARRRDLKVQVDVVDENTVVIQAIKENTPCE